MGTVNLRNVLAVRIQANPIWSPLSINMGQKAGGGASYQYQLSAGNCYIGPPM